MESETQARSREIAGAETETEIKTTSNGDKEGATSEPGTTTESTFGKPGEIVHKSISGMEHAAVSGEERERPRPRVVRTQDDLEQPKPKKTARVAESPTSTHEVRVSPPFGAEGHRAHED
jgi:hypothetical protein